MGKKTRKKDEKVYITRRLKFNLANMIDGLSSAIFANNGIYITITLFARLNMLFWCVPTFCKIFFTFSFINFANSKNSFDAFSNYDRRKYKDYNKSSIDFTIGI
jgi:hypothetical protein